MNRMRITLALVFCFPFLIQARANGQFLGSLAPRTDSKSDRPTIYLPQPPGTEYSFDYGDMSDGANRRTYQRGRCSLVFAEKEFGPIDQALASREIADAYRLIEPLGFNEKPLCICLVKEIKPLFEIKEKERVVSGLTFTTNGYHYIAVRYDSVNFDTLGHELCHLRLRELGCSYSIWLEEGLCECFESWTYSRQEHVETLKKGAIATMCQLTAYDKPLQGNEEVLRATAWALAYHLMVQKQTPFADLEEEAKKLDINAVVQEVLTAHEP